MNIPDIDNHMVQPFADPDEEMALICPFCGYYTDENDDCETCDERRANDIANRTPEAIKDMFTPMGQAE